MEDEWCINAVTIAVNLSVTSIHTNFYREKKYVGIVILWKGCLMELMSKIIIVTFLFIAMLTWYFVYKFIEVDKRIKKYEDEHRLPYSGIFDEWYP